MIKVYKNECEVRSVEIESFHTDAWQELASSNDEYIFSLDKSYLEFIDIDHGKINFDIDSMLNYHKLFFYKHSIYEQPLAKALGLKKGKNKPEVIDASAGTLKDSSLISSFGVESLILFERNPLVAVLIEDAIRNSKESQRFKFHFGSILDSALDFTSKVIYFDPMYEGKNSKAAPRKGMQLFRKHVGVDKDALESAKKMQKMCSRIVIKRSVKASPLLENPSMSFGKKSTVYDVYLNH